MLCTAQEDDAEQGGDDVSASEARKRLERLRQKHKQDEARRQMDQVGGALRLGGCVVSLYMCCADQPLSVLGC